ncbi:hypothetical protein GCM10023205_78180 [Yinghuangia aomiensis]|uniref:Uncharacterized protein n=1 Tax=Yinghuangia aomiensis TaxID=676205 RepID=A0ABP9ICH6_9ACTN
MAAAVTELPEPDDDASASWIPEYTAIAPMAAITTARRERLARTEEDSPRKRMRGANGPAGRQRTSRTTAPGYPADARTTGGNRTPGTPGRKAAARAERNHGGRFPAALRRAEAARRGDPA